MIFFAVCIADPCILFALFKTCITWSSRLPLRLSKNKARCKAALRMVGALRNKEECPSKVVLVFNPSVNAFCGWWQDAQLRWPLDESPFSKKSFLPNSILEGEVVLSSKKR